MRFLIDNALPPRLADLLLSAGHDAAVHVRAYGMQGAPDEQIIVRAAEENRIVVSADSDFSAILAAQEAEHPSAVPMRGQFVEAQHHPSVQAVVETDEQ